MPYKRLKILKGYIDWGLGPALRLMWRLGLRPLHLTLLSLPCGVLGVWFVYSRPIWSAFFILSYLGLDVLDGTMARVTHSVTRLGHVLDSAIDRLVASLFLVTYYLHGGDIMLPIVGLTFAAVFTLEDFGLIKRQQ